MKPVNEIQVDLVSNASMLSYPGNTLSTFTNTLAEPLEFEGDWEVGVLEIFHPSELDPKQTKSVNISLIRDVGGPVRTKSFAFEYGLEDSGEKIIRKLNKTFENMNVSYTADPWDKFGQRETKIDFKPIKLEKQKPEDKTYTLTLGYIKGSGLFNVETVKFAPLFDDQNFIKALGFDLDQYYTATQIPMGLIATKAPTKPVNANLLFIYSDIVREHHVGDSMSNCLRAIPLIAGDDKALSTHTFPMPYYFPVRYNTIRNISILLTDETGTPLRFSTGRTFITLHFRKQLYKAYP